MNDVREGAPTTGPEKPAGKEPPLETRLRDVRRHWRRPALDYVFRILSVAVALAVLILALTLASAWSPLGAQETNTGSGTVAPAVQAEAGATSARNCPPEVDWPATPPLLLVAADVNGPARPLMLAMRESVASYFRVDVRVASAAEYRAGVLDDVAGVIVFANGVFGEKDRIGRLIDDARTRGLSVMWVGPGAHEFADGLGLTFNDSMPVAGRAPQGSFIDINGATIPAAGFPLAPPVTATSEGRPQVLATIRLPDQETQPVIVANGKVIHVGFLPFDGLRSNLALAATINALAHSLGKHEQDPRVLFRLEDINGYMYGPGDNTFSKVADYLLGENVFMHLSIIPEWMDEHGNLVTDIGAAESVIRLFKENPDATEIVQHGYRHYRMDRRNKGAYSSVAFEFFLDDDVTMGADAAAEFARQRLSAGQEVLSRYLHRAWIFEAPHYVMSPAEQSVAEGMYPVILHPLQYHDGVRTEFFFPWFTRRENTFYGPSDVGYVGRGDLSSVTRILRKLAEIARILPDPVVIVFYHPFMIQAEGQEQDLQNLVEGIKRLGYRFTSVCEELTSHN